MGEIFQQQAKERADILRGVQGHRVDQIEVLLAEGEHDLARRWLDATIQYLRARAVCGFLAQRTSDGAAVLPPEHHDAALPPTGVPELTTICDAAVTLRDKAAAAYDDIRTEMFAVADRIEGRPAS